LNEAVYVVFENKDSYLRNIGIELTPKHIIDAIRLADAFSVQE
jgi:hypothetical protein